MGSVMVDVGEGVRQGSLRLAISRELKRDLQEVKPCGSRRDMERPCHDGITPVNDYPSSQG